MRELSQLELDAVGGGWPEGIVMLTPPLNNLPPVAPPPPLSPMPGPNAAPSPYAPYQGGGLL